MPNLIYYEYNRYGMNGGYYGYNIDHQGKVYKIVYKLKIGIPNVKGAIKNIDWACKTYKTIEIEY